jgi:hypothetical protein
MSAPTQYLEGTSVVHISETFFPGDPLMDAALYPGDVIRRLTPVERGMFYDMGWTVPEPSAPALFGVAVLSILVLRRSRVAMAARGRVASPSRSLKSGCA